MVLGPDSTLRGEVAGKLACPLRDLHVTIPATLPAAEFSGEASYACKGLMHGWRNRKADALGESRNQFALQLCLFSIILVSIIWLSVLVFDWLNATGSHLHLIFTRSHER